jgi:hypothetical protein
LHRARARGASVADSLLDVHAGAAAMEETWRELDFGADAELVVPRPRVLLSASDPETILTARYARLVGQHERDHVGGLNDSEIRQRIKRTIEEADLDAPTLVELPPVQLAHREIHFAFGWQNGQKVYADSISFDLHKKDAILNKAEQWESRLTHLYAEHGAGFVAIIAPPRDESLTEPYESARALLQNTGVIRNVFMADHLQELPALIAHDTWQE